MTMPDRPRHRPIRSYVLREGRVTAGQERALATLWPRFGVDYAGVPLDLSVLFGNDRPVWLEIGVGNGDNLAALAERHPDRNFLGIEVHRPGIGHLLLRLETRALGNVRLLRHDAVEVLSHSLAPASLAGAFLFFPDPWPKRRHHKRRILQPGLVDLLARAIRPGGLFLAATDCEGYAQQMLAVIEASPAFENLAGRGAFSPRPQERTPTRFEQRSQRLGLRVWDLVLRRRP